MRNGPRAPSAFVPWPDAPRGADASEWTDERARDFLDQIDPPIRPFVVALNQTGWARTVFSCAGHPDEPDSTARGRRQAHVDVVTCDLGRWLAFTRAVGQRLRTLGPLDAVDAADGAGMPAERAAARVRVRGVEGPLGDLPGWLRASLPAPAGPASTPPGSGGPEQARRWLGQLVARGRELLSSAPGTGGWHYRRLVFEPVPYDAPPAACRHALDQALGAALAALEQSTGRSSQ
jgi:hypothetical protein